MADTWQCPVCEDQGVIRNWQGTLWDCSHIRVLTEHTQAQDTVRVTNLPLRSDKVRRNTPCPCGSGKKFKKCCGAPGRAVH